MNQATFKGHTFHQALTRARAREAAALAAIAAGNGPKPSRDIGDMLRQQAQDHMTNVLCLKSQQTI